MIVIVIGVDDIVKDLVDFRFVLQIDGVVHLQGIRSDGTAYA